jgi:hypothetical protein
MKPRNENNFLIEVTPEQLDELRKAYRYAENDTGYEELHYSPYWKSTKLEAGGEE